MFRNGDRVAFLGDSITEGGVYHRILADYYLTRCPEADIRFTNCGRGGGGARDAAVRFADDVAARNPTAVAVMFGMNDVGRPSYATNLTPDNIREQQERIADYRGNLAALLDVCASNCPDAALLLLTPSPCDDQRVFYRNPACVRFPGANAGIGMCAEAVRGEAAKRGATLVDLYTVLNACVRERRRGDPDFKFAPDRVHPCPGIHLLMAMAFLEAQNADRVVSDIAIREGRCLKSVKAEVSDIVTDGAGGVSFTALEKSLPMPFDDEVADCTNAPVVAAFNQQILAFYCLGDGDWTLRIDGVEVCTASSLEWERGVNLAFNPKTPQLRQAMAAMKTNRARAERANEIEAARPRIRRDMRNAMPRRGLDAENAEDRRAFLMERLAEMTWKRDIDQWTAAVGEWDEQEALIVECDAAWPAVRALAKPVPHKYELSRKEPVK